MKKIFFITCVSFGILLGASKVNAVAPVCGNPFGMDIDLFGSIGRALSTAVKYFLSDDKKLVADLVYNEKPSSGKGGGKGSPSPGGCGGTYTGDNGSLSLNAAATANMDIPAEAGAYPEDIRIQDNSVGKLADLRAREILKGQASLDELSANKWAIEYRAQQRAIQAMTDALVMKKVYASLASVAANLSSGSYANYSEAASTVATRRLMLDALMSLRKRVIAARVRARAETMEAVINTTAIPSQAVIDESNFKKSSTNDPSQKIENTDTSESQVPEKIEVSEDAVTQETNE